MNESEREIVREEYHAACDLSNIDDVSAVERYRAVIAAYQANEIKFDEFNEQMGRIAAAMLAD